MEKTKKQKIVFTGGGTGGHIFPLVAIIRELKNIFPKDSLEIYYIGPKDVLVENYIKKEGVEIRYIKTGKMRRYLTGKSIIQNILDIFFRIPFGVIQSFFYLYIFSPDLVFGKGGYGSLPVILIAKLFNIPIILHESDAVAGAVNQFLQKMSTEIFVSFPKTEKIINTKMFVIGNPVRKEILEGKKEEAKKIFNLKSEKPLILILGGSQGSERINNLFLSSSSGFLEKFEILHQCGSNNYKQVLAESAVAIKEELKPEYHLFPFFDEEQLAHAYAAADLIISRAGSGSIFEIAAVGKGGVLLPLPEAAQNHQLKNAYAYAATGSGVVFEEGNMSHHFFLEKIKELFSPIEQIRAMEKNTKNFARPRAGFVTASYLKEYLQQKD
jgi:UDP-N-acetylglucosamine--N-acetylmuramyl-(pentapeptide) pyrophosphoryl-undecaprenol N-acetylglucosamine transferase